MRNIVSKFLRYLVTGSVAAVVDVSGFKLLLDARSNVFVAGVASFCAAALVNYLLTSQFVFGRVASARGFVSFLFAALIGLGVNVSVTMLGPYLLGLPPVLAKIMGIGTAFAINFTMNLLFVFQQKTNTGQVV